jgi:hypothetical protein
MEVFESQGSYWTNCSKFHCGCGWYKIVNLMIFVCWELRKVIIMISALKRLTRIVNLNVLLSHEERRYILWSFFRMWNWKQLISILFPFPTESTTICSQH